LDTTKTNKKTLALLAKVVKIKIKRFNQISLLSQPDVARVIEAIRDDNILIAQAQKFQTTEKNAAIDMSRGSGMGM
jgi:hypothetical protein